MSQHQSHTNATTTSGDVYCCPKRSIFNVCVKVFRDRLLSRRRASAKLFHAVGSSQQLHFKHIIRKKQLQNAELQQFRPLKTKSHKNEFQNEQISIKTKSQHIQLSNSKLIPQERKKMTVLEDSLFFWWAQISGDSYYYYYYYHHFIAAQPALASTPSQELDDFVGAKFYYLHALADGN